MWLVFSLCVLFDEMSIRPFVRYYIGLFFIFYFLFLRILYRGAWVTQSVKNPALDFSSGHELTVCGFRAHVGLCASSAEPAWDSLSLPLSLSAPLPLALSLSLSKFINKLKKIKKRILYIFRIQIFLPDMIWNNALLT